MSNFIGAAEVLESPQRDAAGGVCTGGRCWIHSFGYFIRHVTVHASPPRSIHFASEFYASL